MLQAAAVIAWTLSGAKNAAGDIVPAFIRANSYSSRALQRFKSERDPLLP